MILRHTIYVPPWLVSTVGESLFPISSTFSLKLRQVIENINHYIFHSQFATWCIFISSSRAASLITVIDRDVSIHKDVNLIARICQFLGAFLLVSVLKSFDKRLVSARTETRLPPGGPFMARDGCDGHEDRTRSRGASRGSSRVSTEATLVLRDRDRSSRWGEPRRTREACAHESRPGVLSLHHET